LHTKSLDHAEQIHNLQLTVSQREDENKKLVTKSERLKCKNVDLEDQIRTMVEENERKFEQKNAYITGLEEQLFLLKNANKRQLQKIEKNERIIETKEKDKNKTRSKTAKKETIKDNTLTDNDTNKENLSSNNESKVKSNKLVLKKNNSR